MTEEFTLEQKIANLEKTTEKLLSLPKTFTLKNGWKKRELMLHLWSWDFELIRACDAKMSDNCDNFKLEHNHKKMEYTDWNDLKIEEKKNLSDAEVKDLFTTARKKIIAKFKKLIKLPETIEDEKNFFRTDRLVSLYWHDNMHLEQGGEKIEF